MKRSAHIRSFLATLVALLAIAGCSRKTSVLGADNGIRFVTTVRTNESGTVSVKEVFTRDGQTNLVRRTSTKSGAVQIRVHRFYCRGLLVGDFVAMPDSSGFTTQAGSPYSVSFEFDAAGNPRSAVIGAKDGVVLDLFSYTNGVFDPVDAPLIQKANAVGADMKQLFDPEHVRKTSPEGFVREAETLIEKHKAK